MVLYNGMPTLNSEEHLFVLGTLSMSSDPFVLSRRCQFTSNPKALRRPRVRSYFFITLIACALLSISMVGECEGWTGPGPLQARSGDGQYEVQVFAPKTARQLARAVLFRLRSDKTKQIVWRRNLLNIPWEVYVYTATGDPSLTAPVRVVTVGSSNVRGFPSERSFLVFYGGAGEVIKDYAFDEVLPRSKTGLLPHTARLRTWFWAVDSPHANTLSIKVSYSSPLEFDLTTGTGLYCTGHRNPGLSLSIKFHTLPASLPDAAFDVTLTNISQHAIPVPELEDSSNLFIDFYDGQGKRLHFRDIECPPFNPNVMYRSLQPNTSVTKSFRWRDIVRRNPHHELRFGVHAYYSGGPVPGHPEADGCAEAPPLTLEYKDGKISKFGLDLLDEKTALNQELGAAVIERDVPAVKALLAQHADPNTVHQSEVSDWWNNGPVLLLAVRPTFDPNADDNSMITDLPPPLEPDERTYTELVRTLLIAGSDPNESNATGTTPLIEAVRQNHRNGVLMLLDRDAKIEARNSRGQSALMVVHDDPTIYNALIEHKADVNATDRDGTTPLMFAAENGDMRLVATLLRKGVPVNARNRAGRTALWFGASGPDVVRVLLTYSAQMETNGDKGAAVLFNAFSPASLKLLIDAGLDVNLRNEDGQTVLMDAVLRDPRCVKVLVTNGAEVNARTTGKYEKGYTALMRAVKADSPDVASILVAHRADVNVRAADGETALSLAVNPRSYGGPKEHIAALVRLLKQAGARE
jgi:ankyrin repeat protein